MRFTIPFIDRVSHLDKLLFAKHLSTMIKAGLSLREGVATIQEQISSKKFKKVLDDVIKQLDNGQSLADSLARHPRVFSELFINMVKIGEASGTLEENLGHLALQLEKSYDLRRKVKAAMIYPVLVLVSTFGLGGALALFVLPKLVPLFKSFDIKLPMSTRILLWITETFQNYGFYVILFLCFLVGVLVFLSRLGSVKSNSHKLILKVPVVGKVVRDVNLARFSRTLGTLLKSGISIVEALNITAGTLGNMSYQVQTKAMALKVQRGQEIAAYLKDRPKLFPPTLSHMISVGEKTGNLEDSLLYLAEFYEKEVDSATKNLSVILEPMLLIFIGIIVAFIAVSIITPIYQLTRGLRG